MMCERDILRRYVLPELSNYYNPKGIDIQLIDLRWGVVADGNDKESIEERILKCCFDAIDICKPFFIGFLGHRYGWIPDQSNKVDNDIPLSVTHMEIEHGVLWSKNYSHSLIFTREANSYKNVPPEDYNIFVDRDENLKDYANSQLRRIKEGYEEANAVNNIISYSLDPYKHSDEDVYKLTQLILSNLIRIIDGEIEGDADFSLIHSCETFLKDYIPPKDFYNTLLSNVTAGNQTLVYGKQGVGKTSLAVYLYNYLRGFKEQINVFFYSSDIKLDNKISLKDTIRLWTESLAQNKLLELKTIEEEWSRFKRIQQAQPKYSFIILDGYDKFDEILDSNLFLLPCEKIIYVVFNSTPLPKWESRFNIKPLELFNFTQSDAEEYLNQILNDAKKYLPDYVYQAIIRQRVYEGERYNPLDLSLLMSYILSLDKADFDKIRINSDIAPERALYDYIASIVREMPNDSTLRSNYILKKIIDIFGQEKLLPLLYIAHSRYGLSEGQLRQVVNTYDPIAFYLIRNYIKPYMPIMVNGGKWLLSDTSILDAITENVSQKSASFYMRALSDLDSIPDDEKFYYGIYGYNKELIYRLYSAPLENGQGIVYSKYLQKYFEDENNLKWFLSILDIGSTSCNEQILSNLFYLFYSYYARQNPKIDNINFLILLKEKIETTECALIDNDKFYYLGSIYEALGRDIMNRNINKIDKHLAIKYLQGAFMYYKCCSGAYAELAIDHLKNYITNRL